ncbi:MAG: sigma-54 dependent transcriptional regulator [Planctomycetota bacterium]|nr:sigma-54 dependent transcriptional regulator [Planctomycetota bacterium]
MSESTSQDIAHRILVVEDDASYGLLLRYQLQREGYEPIVVQSGEEGLKKLGESEPSVVLLDVMLPGKDGRVILDEIHRNIPELPVVMVTAAGSVEMAVECMKRGAYDFLTKPFEFERLYAILRNAIEYHELKMQVRNLEGALFQKHGFEKIVAASERMRKVIDQAQRAAASDSDVLILGESGTGKEVLARAVHYGSSRRNGPFVAINCGAIPEGLLESELFGHEKGAFTGAVARRAGCFEQAHGGTLFLDEIGEMRPDMQVRLLRALEQREIRRVGSDKTIKVNVRVFSATNQNLPKRMKESKFRTDLYYRLAILVLEIPRCATGAKTSQRWRDISWSRPAARDTPAPRIFQPRPCACSASTTGPATRASCATPSSAPWSSRTDRTSRSRACRRNWCGASSSA